MADEASATKLEENHVLSLNFEQIYLKLHLLSVYLSLALPFAWTLPTSNNIHRWNRLFISVEKKF